MQKLKSSICRVESEWECFNWISNLCSWWLEQSCRAGSLRMLRTLERSRWCGKTIESWLTSLKDTTSRLRVRSFCSHETRLYPFDSICIHKTSTRIHCKPVNRRLLLLGVRCYCIRIVIDFVVAAIVIDRSWLSVLAASRISSSRLCNSWRSWRELQLV